MEDQRCLWWCLPRPQYTPLGRKSKICTARVSFLLVEHWSFICPTFLSALPIVHLRPHQQIVKYFSFAVSLLPRAAFPLGWLRAMGYLLATPRTFPGKPHSDTQVSSWTVCREETGGGEWRVQGVWNSPWGKQERLISRPAFPLPPLVFGIIGHGSGKWSLEI